MKLIVLPFRFELTLPGEVVNITELQAEIQRRKSRAAEVVASAHSIEQSMTDVIKAFLFADLAPDKRQFIEGELLSSDWFTYAGKRKLLNALISRFDLLLGVERAALDEALSKVGSYRNALTHGIITYDSANFVVRFYEGGPREKILDDDYWETLSGWFRKAANTLMVVREKVQPVVHAVKPDGE
jgi:hypothetical protein